MYTKDWNENSEMICTVRLLNLTDCTFNVSCTNHVLLIWSYFDLFFLFLYKNAGILFLLLFYYSSIVHFFSLHVQCQLHLSVLWWWSERKPKADAQRRLECTGMGGGRWCNQMDSVMNPLLILLLFLIFYFLDFYSACVCEDKSKQMLHDN